LVEVLSRLFVTGERRARTERESAALIQTACCKKRGDERRRRKAVCEVVKEESCCLLCGCCLWKDEFCLERAIYGGREWAQPSQRGTKQSSMTPPLRSGHCCKVTYHSSRSSNDKLYDESIPVKSRYNFPEVKVSPIQAFLPVQNDHLSSGDGQYSEDVHSRYSDFHRCD